MKFVVSIFVLVKNTKTNIMKTRLIISLIVVLFSSCTDFLDQNHFEVDPRLRPYVDRFYEEAAKRGVRVQRENLLVSIQNGLDENEYGRTIHSGLKSIYINKNFFNQNIKDSAYLKRIEFVVFHEMGHAVLNRGHESNDNFSIMTCCSDWMASYTCSCINDNSIKEKLINELFNKIM